VEIHAIPSALADRAEAGGLNGDRGMTDAPEGGVEHNLRGERIKEGNFFYFYRS
jgi:hypothetical protein